MKFLLFFVVGVVLILLGHLSHEAAEGKLVVGLRNQFEPVFMKLGNRFEPVLCRHGTDGNELLVLGRPVGLVVVVVLDVQTSFRGDLASVLFHVRRQRLDDDVGGDDALVDFGRVVKEGSWKLKSFCLIFVT